MSKIALIDVDSTIPNLALMKLAGFHSSLDDDVSWYVPLLREEYDHIYASTLFDFSDKSILDPQKMEIGGTGWKGSKDLPNEIEQISPDYSIYNYPHNIGFTMRGCRLRCPFCVVPTKEGKPKSDNTIDEIWQQRDSDFIVLLDNDFFGNPNWEARVAELLDFKLWVNFNQGLNIRNIKPHEIAALSGTRFSNRNRTRRQVHFAWDDPRHEKLIRKGIERCLAGGIKAHEMAFYVLIGYWSTPEEDLHRVTVLHDYGCDPYVMPYKKDDVYQSRFARWVNHKAVFNTIGWSDYCGSVKGRKGDIHTLELFE